MPAKQQMEQEKHAANLDATRLNMAATRQNMATQAQTNEAAKHEAIYKMTGSLSMLPEDVQEKVWPVMRTHAIKAGYATANDMPKTYDENAKNLITNAAAQSGQYLAQLKAQGNQKPMSVVDPNTGQPIIVSEQEAIQNRYAPYNAKATNNAGTLLTKAQINNYVKTQDELALKATSAEDIINNTNSFLAAAKEIPTGTGPGMSYLATVSAPGQEARKYAGKLAFAEVKQLGGGVVSDADLAAAERNTLSLSNSMEANNKIAATNIAIARRAQEKQSFYQQMAEAGLYDTAKMQKQWTKFTKENPIIDKKTGRVNEQNIGNWAPYITMGNTAKTADNSPAPMQDKIVVGKNGKRYQKVEGGYVLVD
jgi:hypothetical protein